LVFSEVVSIAPLQPIFQSKHSSRCTAHTSPAGRNWCQSAWLIPRGTGAGTGTDEAAGADQPFKFIDSLFLLLRQLLVDSKFLVPPHNRSPEGNLRHPAKRKRPNYFLQQAAIRKTKYLPTNPRLVPPTLSLCVSNQSSSAPLAVYLLNRNSLSLLINKAPIGKCHLLKSKRTKLF
jgi:hypothetical protein